MIEKTIQIGTKKFPYLTNENEIDTEKIVIYFHGLGGSANESKPIFNNIKDYTIMSFKQRGHQNDFLPASRFYKKYVQDVYEIVKYFKDKNKKIYLLGDSMGAAYISILTYYHPELIEATFACAIPTRLTNIFLEKNSTQSKIFFRTTMTYLFNWNYEYEAKIDYHKLTNNKTLLRLSQMQNDTQLSKTRNIISTWRAIRKYWRIITKKAPQVPFYYFQGDDDIMIKEKSLSKLQKASKKYPNFHYEIIKNSKHILLHEQNATFIFEIIKNIINK